MPPRQKTSIARSPAFVKSSTDVFSKMKDEDFYGPKVQHVFLYGTVTSEKLEKLSRDIVAANREGVPTSADAPATKPRPIVIHINSPGGYINEGLAMRALLGRSKVPICALVEGMSASAATFVSIFAPYRVICKEAVVLIHQYSAVVWGQKEMMESQMHEINVVYKSIVDDYVQHTKLKESDLKELVKHDLFMDAKWALKNGVTDRIIDPVHKGHKPEHSFIKTIQSNSVNNMVMKPDVENYGLDTAANISQMVSGAPQLQTVVIRPTNGSVYDTFDAVAIANHVKSIPTTTYMLLDGSFMDLVSIIPLMYCSHRVMYTHSTLNLSGTMFFTGAHIFDDIIHNTKLNFEIIRGILKTTTKLPDNVIESLKSARTVFTAEDCLKYGIVDELVDA